MDLYLGGLIIGRIFASEIWGAYFQAGLFVGEGLLPEFLDIFETEMFISNVVVCMHGS